MKVLLTLVLLAFSSIACADYRVELRDNLGEKTIVFASCEIDDSLTFQPGEKESSYLFANCDDQVAAGYHFGTVESLASSAFEEVAISYDVSGYIEKYDCYLVRFAHEGPLVTGDVVIECGDMHALPWRK